MAQIFIGTLSHEDWVKFGNVTKLCSLLNLISGMGFPKGLFAHIQILYENNLTDFLGLYIRTFYKNF